MTEGSEGLQSFRSKLLALFRNIFRSGRVHWLFHNEGSFQLAWLARTYRLTDGAFKILDKYFDTFFCKVMSEVEGIQRLVQVDVSIWNRLQSVACLVDSFVDEVMIRHWKPLCSPRFKDLCRNRHKFHAQGETSQ